LNLIKKIKIFFLFHQRKYNIVIKNTVINEFKDIKNIDTYSLRYQVYSSFYTKNFNHSRMCLEILQEKNKLSAKDALYLAYIYARHNEKEKAIATWCYSLEKNKSTKIAKKALDYLRQKGRDINLMDDEYFDSITPPEPFILPLKSILFILFFLVLSFSIFIIGYNNSGRLSSYLQNLKKINENKELSKIKLPDFNPNLIVSPKENDIKFSYDEKEIKRKFENIKQNILNDKAVAAVLEINEIKLSNASESVKLKTDILKTFIREPDYAFFKNQITYSDILNEKKSLNGNIRLYDDVFVLWEGRIVNLKIGKEEIIFDYILGDEEKGIVLGIEKVVFKKAVIIKNNDKIKVFGKIKVNDKSFYIDGKFVIKN